MGERGEARKDDAHVIGVARTGAVARKGAIIHIGAQGAFGWVFREAALAGDS
jgi:hypothetical protein